MKKNDNKIMMMMMMIMRKWTNCWSDTIINIQGSRKMKFIGGTTLHGDVRTNHVLYFDYCFIVEHIHIFKK